MIHAISKFIPLNSVALVEDILKNNPISIKIVNNRTTKHGDFKKTKTGEYQITINNSLNEYQFLLTLIHEIAHYKTHQQFKNVKPHGLEWKQHFQHLMLPFLHPEIFPNELLPFLANYLKNPKASTGSDIYLTKALLKFNPQKNGKKYIFEIKTGNNFVFKNKVYQMGNKRRTRVECLEIKSNKLYLFNQNAEVELIEK